MKTRINTRAKGQRQENRAISTLRATGYEAFKLYQPKFQKQGVIDVIAIGWGRVRLISVKSNRWRMSEQRELRSWLVPDRCVVTKEIWRYRDGKRGEEQRVIE